MSLKVVYDPNVIVSAVLKPGSIPASLVALVMGKRVRLFLSPAIFEEYIEVLKRPKFGFDPRAIDAFLRDLKRAAVTVYPTQRITKASDESDYRFLECAQAANADYLVTGNRKHFPLPRVCRNHDRDAGRVCADRGRATLARKLLTAR